MSKNKKSALLALVLLALLLAAAVIAYVGFGPDSSGSPENKSIEVTVVHGDGTEILFSIATQAQTLGEAWNENELIAGEEGPYGLYIMTVDGETVDETKQQWWCITKGGESVTTGADSLPIADGDQFELTLTEGY